MTNEELHGFFLDKLQTLMQQSRLRLTICRSQPALTRKGVAHMQYWRLVAIISGERNHCYADGNRIVNVTSSAGDILLVEPYAGLWSEEDQTYDMLSIVGKPAFIRLVSKQRTSGDIRPNDPDEFLHAGSEETKIAMLLMEALFLSQCRNTPSDFLSFLQLIVDECETAMHSRTGEQMPNSQYLLENIITFVDDHLREELSCGRIADEFKINANYVAQLFVRFRQCGFAEYVRDMRLELAASLLRSSRMNIGEIADYCGFSQANYFIRVFKKHYAMTPHNYRLWLFSQIQNSKSSLYAK
ncbi:MAG: helix-turn-helix transcriptional regulator [Lentisphaerota bacterium]